MLHVIDALGVGGGAEHSLAAILPLLDERGIDSSIAVTIPRVGGLQEMLSRQEYPITVLRGRTLVGRALSLRRLAQDTAPDVVHSTLYYSCLTARLALIGSRTPLLNSRVSTSYHPSRTTDDATSPWKLRLIRWFDRITARRLVDHFHVVTGEVRTETVDTLAIPEERTTVIPRGRSVRQLGEFSSARRKSTRESLGVGPETKVVLNVGRQDHAKDHVTLAYAFARVRETHPEALLLLAGREGDGSDALRASLAELDLGNSVRLLGHRDDVADLYVAADVMAFPSLYEGAAGAVIEAMALRLPVVGSEAVEEVLQNGALGPVVKRGDVDGLAREVTALLDDPTRREQLAEPAHNEFTLRYDIDSVADLTADLYRSLRKIQR